MSQDKQEAAPGLKCEADVKCPKCHKVYHGQWLEGDVKPLKCVCGTSIPKPKGVKPAVAREEE